MYSLSVGVAGHACRRRRQPRKLTQARARSQIVQVAGLPQESEQAVQLPHRLSARDLDRGQRLLRLDTVTVDHDPGGAGLDAHHAHVVGDDVMQLPRDPHALLEHGVLGLCRT